MEVLQKKSLWKYLFFKHYSLPIMQWIVMEILTDQKIISVIDNAMDRY
jgi:hypothetical protein